MIEELKPCPEMIEKVARAIARSDGVPDNAPLGDYLRNAKDVIAVLPATDPDKRLIEALQNAVYALEYWERECRVCSDDAVTWVDGPYERGLEEIKRGNAALSHNGG